MSVQNTNFVEYDLLEAMEASKVLLFHASKDDSLPLLTAATIGKDTNLEWLATDRYTLGEYTFSRRDGLLTDILIPREALERLAKIQVTKLREPQAAKQNMYRVRLTVEGKDLKMEVGYRGYGVDWVSDWSQNFDMVEGDYPPVKKLFPQDIDLSPAPHFNFLYDNFVKWGNTSKVLKAPISMTFFKGGRSALVTIGEKFRGVALGVTIQAD